VEYRGINLLLEQLIEGTDVGGIFHAVLSFFWLPFDFHPEQALSLHPSGGSSHHVALVLFRITFFLWQDDIFYKVHSKVEDMYLRR